MAANQESWQRIRGAVPLLVVPTLPESVFKNRPSLRNQALRSRFRILERALRKSLLRFLILYHITQCQQSQQGACSAERSGEGGCLSPLRIWCITQSAIVCTRHEPLLTLLIYAITAPTLIAKVRGKDALLSSLLSVARYRGSLTPHVVYAPPLIGQNSCGRALLT